MRWCCNYAASITCRRSGGVLRPERRARGAQPARMRAAQMRSSQAREGQRSLTGNLPALRASQD